MVWLPWLPPGHVRWRTGMTTFRYLIPHSSVPMSLIIIIIIIIPQSMRAEMTSQAHHSLLRIQYTITTVRDIMYWPRMSADLAEAEEV